MSYLDLNTEIIIFPRWDLILFDVLDNFIEWVFRYGMIYVSYKSSFIKLFFDVFVYCFLGFLSFNFYVIEKESWNFH